MSEARSVGVAILELPARYGEPRRGLEEIDALLAGGPATDLALVPECALTGYVPSTPRSHPARTPSWMRFLQSPDPRLADCDLRPFREPLQGGTFEAIRAIAMARGIAIAAPLVEADGPRTFNAFFVVDAAGALVAHYRKRHPWYPETWATPGDREPPLFSIGGVLFTIAICFDVHFLSRALVSDGDEPSPMLPRLMRADALLFPSAWVEDGDGDERARVLDAVARSGATVVNANWGPGEPAVRGQGTSRVVDPEGERVRIESRGGEARRLDLRIGPRAMRVR